MKLIPPKVVADPGMRESKEIWEAQEKYRTWLPVIAEAAAELVCAEQALEAALTKRRPMFEVVPILARCTKSQKMLHRTLLDAGFTEVN